MTFFTDRKRLGDFLFGAVLLLLIGQRLFHFGEALDSPHTWRQCDTAQYIQTFHEEGIDLLHPSVCWMGGHKTLLLEFPLPEALIAMGYHAFGPSHIVGRVLFFAFFLGALGFFMLIVAHISTVRIAQFATLIFAGLPLSFFYSRALHVDFTALFFAFGMMWFYLKGIEQEKWRAMIIGTAFAIPAFLIKAPYVFYLALPLLGWTLRHKKMVFLLKTLPILLIPVVLFGLWVRHTHLTHLQGPDWDFIPGYHKFTERAGWYFGPMAQRWVPELWKLLWERFSQEVCGWLGLALLAGGMIMGIKSKGYLTILLWFLGTLVYLAIFYNLNLVHNYYQIPFLAPIALFMALFLDQIFKWFPEKHKLWAGLLAGGLLLGVITESVVYAEKNYYIVQEAQIRLGNTIEANTPEEALVIVSWGGLDSHCPNILYRAHRYGWSIPERDLSGALCYDLFKEGATHLAVIRYEAPTGELENFTKIFPDQQVIPVESDGLSVFLYHLDPNYLQPPTP